MTDQPTRENVESETDLSSDLQRTVVGSVPGVGNMGVSTTSTAPLNQDALEAGAKALLAVQQPEVSADYSWNVQFEDGRDELRNETRAAVSAYLAVAQPVVNSVAELDALPVGYLVRTANGREYYKSPQLEYPWSKGRDHDRSSSRHLSHYGPVTVVHRPEVIN